MSATTPEPSYTYLHADIEDSDNYSPDPTLRSCSICGAVVGEWTEDRHTEWHAAFSTAPVQA